VVAHDTARVVAWDATSVEARDSCRVVALGSSSVDASDSCRVEAWGSTSVTAGGSSTVEARESSSVEALGSDGVGDHTSRGTVGTDGVSIPRTVHRIWIGDGPEPEWTRPFAATWERPGWTVRQWSGPEELWPLRNQDLYDRAEEIAPSHVGQLRADILRYEILLRLGGIYVDVDFECLRPLDGLVEGMRAFAVWSVEGRWLANGIMGAEPGHPFLEALVERLPANIEADRRWRPGMISGPEYLTRVWWDCEENVDAVPANLFYPYAWYETAAHDPGKEWPDVYAAHHWLSSGRGA
jgi:hypothetical protein